MFRFRLTSFLLPDGIISPDPVFGREIFGLSSCSCAISDGTQVDGVVEKLQTDTSLVSDKNKAQAKHCQSVQSTLLPPPLLCGEDHLHPRESQLSP